MQRPQGVVECARMHPRITSKRNHDVSLFPDSDHSSLLNLTNTESLPQHIGVTADTATDRMSLVSLHCYYCTSSATFRPQRPRRLARQDIRETCSFVRRVPRSPASSLQGKRQAVIMAAAGVSTISSSSAYKVSQPGFADIICQEEPLRVVAEKDYPFAHEAAVGVRGLNKLFFTSNRLGDKDSPNQHIQLQTLDLLSGEVELLPQHLTDQLPMPNGATNWPGTDDSIVLLTQGHCDVPPAVNKVNLRDMTCEVLLNSYQDKQLNSPNDVVVYKDGTIWFTDPPYGYAQNFRPEPELGNRVYAFNPTTGDVGVLAEKFVKPNGIVFSPDFKTVYVTDTGDKNEKTAPRNQTIYAFDVAQPDSSSSSSHLPSLENRRVFATVESEQPDGIKVDCKGNVYTGTKGGVEVFARNGTKLGTICCGQTTNLAFVDDTLYAMCEQKIVAIKLRVSGATLP